MDDLKILNNGLKDLLNPMKEEEMSFIVGGTVEVTCQEGYSSHECKCGYHGPRLWR